MSAPKQSSTQIDSMSTHESSDPNAKCTVCLVDFGDKEVIKLPCGCLYDAECVKALIEVSCQGRNNFPPVCCDFIVDIGPYEYMLSPEVIAQFNALLDEKDIPTAQLKYCGNPRCSALISRAPTIAFDDKRCKTCAKCGNSTCLYCMETADKHEQVMEQGVSKRKCPPISADVNALKNLAQENKWQTCPACNALVEKVGGCIMVECRCGVEFCYVCTGLNPHYSDCAWALAQENSDEDDENDENNEDDEGDEDDNENDDDEADEDEGIDEDINAGEGANTDGNGNANGDWD